jgi:hypothetical protein
MNVPKINIFLPLSIVGVACVILIPFFFDIDHSVRLTATVLSTGAFVVALLAAKDGRRVGQHHRCPECTGIVRLTKVGPQDTTARNVKKAAEGASNVGAAVGGVFGIAGKVAGAAVPMIVGAIVDDLRSTQAWKCERCKALFMDESALDPPRNGMGCGIALVFASIGFVGFVVFGLL